MLDLARRENEETIKVLKDCFSRMYKFGGNDLEEYDYYSDYAYELLKILSMRVTIGEVALLKRQYYAAIYDGEWNDETETENEEN